MTTQDLKDTVDRETRQSDNTNMLGGTNLMIDPKYSDFIGNDDDDYHEDIFTCFL